MDNQREKATNWTPSQAEAISKTGAQLLVAAGAGSGKTSVLTQRILEKIKAGGDIKDFLIVTFTVASADDMKEKLRKKLTEEYIKNPDNKHLSNQIAKLPFAQISTISSYCLKIVKQNFTSLDLSPALRVADESEATIIFKEAFDTLLDECFSKQNESLYTVLNETACFGSEDRLFTYLERIYYKLRAHPHYIEKLSALTDSFTESAKLCENGEGIEKTPVGKILLDAAELLCNNADRDIDALLKMGEEFGGVLETVTNNFADYFKKGKAFLSEYNFLESSRCYKEASGFYSNAWRKTSMFSGLDEEEKKAYNKLRASARDKGNKASDFLLEISQNGVEDTIICAKIAESLKDLIIRLDEIYSSLKKEKGVVDFTDEEQFAYTLLIDKDGNPTQLCKEIAASTEEVLVDEYQDTNPLQDSLFASIASKDNRFMVGDDKQSIYRFRNAYPDIFNGYKKTFDHEKATCIFLRENFRCSKQIIDFTNEVFRFLWGEPYRNEELVFAKKGGENGDKVTVKTFIKDASSKEALVLEAKYIKNEILKLKENYIKENGEPLEYSDIAILLSSVKNIGEIYAEELRKSGIPAMSGRPGLLIETPEIKLMLSFLKAVDNPHDDIPLASAMNSFIFGFTAEELAQIRRYRDSSLYESVVKFSASNGKLLFKDKRSIKKPKKQVRFINRDADPLKRKCAKFIKQINNLRYKARTTECRQFIWETYENKNILANMSSLPDGETKNGNLLLFYSEAIAFGKRERKTLSAFLKHAEQLCTPAFSPDGNNAVSIMTIHSSKGLEFPVCFLANAGKSLVSRNFGIKPPIIHIDKGIFTPLKTEGLYTRYPVLYQAEEILEKPAEIAESKRRLYVALTRAREKLYIVGSAKKADSLRTSGPDDATSYLSWIYSSSADAIYDTDSSVEEEISAKETLTEEIYTKKVISEEESDFVYPFEESSRLPRKLSVSELEKTSKNEYKQVARKKDFLTVPRFAAETKKVSAAEIGTANHTFMQFASFKNCIDLGVEYEAERLLLTDMITDEQYGMLNFKNLKKFFESPLWSRIQKSKKVFREKRFTVTDNSDSLLGIGNDPVLVQGVIDLFFENEDGTYTVVDYKTDKIRAGEENLLVQRYKDQLSYYSTAVAEMTEKPVKECIIYSFSLGKEIVLNP